MGSKFDPGRRTFLKKAGTGIAGLAASPLLPKGGGIMETTTAKEIVREAVPFDQQEMMGIVDLVIEKGIRPKGEKYYYLTTKDGQQVRAYAPDNWELYGGAPNVYELETLGEDGRVVDSLQFEPDWTGGPEGGEDTTSGKTLYAEDIKYLPDGMEGDVVAEPSFSYQEDFGHYLPDQNTLDKYNTLGDVIMETLPSPGSLEDKITQRKIQEETKKLENKTEVKNKLPSKFSSNIGKVAKFLGKKFPPVRVLNFLQSLKDGLELGDAINKSLGMPSKEEFTQMLEEMQAAEEGVKDLEQIGSEVTSIKDEIESFARQGEQEMESLGKEGQKGIESLFKKKI